MERALDDSRQIRGAVDPVDALAERTIDLELVRILMQIEFLVRVAPVEMRRNIHRDNDHLNRIESGVCHASRCVGEAWTEMCQQNAGLPGGASVPVGGVRGDLLVARGHEPDPALTN